MGYELTHEDGKFYIWSTVVDDYISGPLGTPDDVAKYILNFHGGRITARGIEPYTEQEARRIYKIWYDEAVRVRCRPEEGVSIMGTLDITGIKEGREPTLRKYEEPIRMTPKLKELQVRLRKERR